MTKKKAAKNKVANKKTIKTAPLRKKGADVIPINNQQQKTISDLQQLINRVHAYASLVRRADLYSGLGLSYDGDRDLYETLGYKQTLAYDDYKNLHSREGMPKRVNSAPCDAVWRMPPRIYDIGETEPSEFERAWLELTKKHKLWNKCNRADKLLGFGDYSILLLGLNDASSDTDLAQKPKEGNLELLYIQCYSSEHATIKEFVNDVKDERNGLPLIYEVEITQLTGEDSGATRTVSVHWSRIIHLLEGNLENDVYGEPRLKNPFNRLKDIQKIVGGSGEMYWRGAFPGQVAKLGEDYQDVGLDTDDAADPNSELYKMKVQFEEYEHKLRRWLTVKGVDISSIDVQVVDPSKHLDAQIQDLSAGTGIPKRILTGSERGELASSEDRSNWIDRVEERRTWFADPVVVEPFIDRCIDYGILPEPKDGEYIVEWTDMRELSTKEKAEIGKVRAESLSAYLKVPGADMIMPPEAFIRYGLGLNEEAITEIKEMYEKVIAEEAAEEAADAAVAAAEEEEEIEEEIDEG